MDDKGQTALMHACESEDPRVIIPFLKCARDKQIDVNAKDSFGLTAFLRACLYTKDKRSCDGRLDIMLSYAKDLRIDLMIACEGLTGFDHLTPEIVDQLRVKFPDLVPTTKAFATKAVTIPIVHVALPTIVDSILSEKISLC